MNSAEIENLLTQHCKHSFQGVFGSENYELSKIPCFLVLNTQSSNQTGLHWIAMYINSEMCEFFDPLGHPPSYYHKDWENLLQKFSSRYAYSSRCLQDPASDTCGHYCVYYVLLRSSGFDFATVLDMSENLQVKKFIERLS